MTFAESIMPCSPGGRLPRKTTLSAPETKGLWWWIIPRILGMNNEVPLVVPEVNKQVLQSEHTLIANPNCSTIQVVVALAAIFSLRPHRLIYSTYQSVSGTGRPAISELEEATRAALDGTDFAPRVYPTSIAFETLPLIGALDPESHYTGEEEKMRNETRKIFGRQDLKISATCVRVPTCLGHAVSVSAICEEVCHRDTIAGMFRHQEGVVYLEDPQLPLLKVAHR